MLLFETFASTFYIDSHIPLSGKITLRDLRINVHPKHNGIEMVLERAKPAHRLSWSRCVCMTDSRNGVAKLGMPPDHIYTVQPVGDVQRSDLQSKR
jgi:hypothetical protein